MVQCLVQLAQARVPAQRMVVPHGVVLDAGVGDLDLGPPAEVEEADRDEGGNDALGARVRVPRVDEPLGGSSPNVETSTRAGSPAASMTIR